MRASEANTCPPVKLRRRLKSPHELRLFQHFHRSFSQHRLTNSQNSNIKVHMNNRSTDFFFSIQRISPHTLDLFFLRTGKTCSSKRERKKVECGLELEQKNDCYGGVIPKLLISFGLPLVWNNCKSCNRTGKKILDAKNYI